MIDKLIPWWPQIRLFFQLVLVCAALGGVAGAVYIYEEKKVTALHEQIAAKSGADAQGTADALANKSNVEDAQNEISRNIALSYADTIRRLDWLRKHPKETGNSVEYIDLPGQAESAVKPSETISESRRACPSDTTRCEVDTEFYWRALEDAASVDSWGDWANRQGM